MHSLILENTSSYQTSSRLGVSSPYLTRKYLPPASSGVTAMRDKAQPSCGEGEGCLSGRGSNLGVTRGGYSQARRPSLCSAAGWLYPGVPERSPAEEGAQGPWGPSPGRAPGKSEEEGEALGASWWRTCLAIVKFGILL